VGDLILNPTCRGLPGDGPSGTMRASVGSREQMSNTEAEIATTDRGESYQFMLRLPCTLTEFIRICCLVPSTLYSPLGPNVRCVGLDRLPGGVGGVPDRPIAFPGERKCRPGAEAKASSGAQGEEGECCRCAPECQCWKVCMLCFPIAIHFWD
jgi:hypothetical protein